MPARLQRLDQKTAYDSPWSLRTRLKLFFWIIVYRLLFRPTPKFFNRWRITLLRIFGAKITGYVFVDASSVIKFPWNLIMEDRACLGPEAECYNLAPITLKARCTIAQQAYLCGGTHDFTVANLPLVIGEIVIGEDAFIGARAFILPGVNVGEGAILGANSTATKDLEPWTVYVGTPCKPIKHREFAAQYPNHC